MYAPRAPGMLFLDYFRMWNMLLYAEYSVEKIRKEGPRKFHWGRLMYLECFPFQINDVWSMRDNSSQSERRRKGKRVDSGCNELKSRAISVEGGLVDRLCSIIENVVIVIRLICCCGSYVASRGSLLTKVGKWDYTLVWEWHIDKRI